MGPLTFDAATGMKDTIAWLLEADNPAVRYRTQTEILGKTADRSESAEWILRFLPEDWQQADGLTYTYHVAALAECGLTKEDIAEDRLQKAFALLDDVFAYGCADFMLLTALVKLGFQDHPAVRRALQTIGENALPDGGFLCRRRRDKLNHIPKSCYKANLHALLLLSECKKKNAAADFGDALIRYFLDRDIFYKSDRSALVVETKEGWRTIDTFFPFEPMRVGLQNVVEALSSLGLGDHPAAVEAVRLLDAQKDEHGRVRLSGTLTKSYLPKEKINKPSKWVTFYTVLAEKERAEG